MSVQMHVTKQAEVVKDTKEARKEEKKTNGVTSLPDLLGVSGRLYLMLHHPEAFASRREREASRALRRRVKAQNIAQAKASVKIFENHFVTKQTT